MNWVDYAIVAVIVVSVLIGLARGLIRELLSLIVWACALLVAWIFYPDIQGLLEPWIPAGSVRLAAAYLILVFGVLVIGTLLGHLLTALVEKTALTGTDRLLGGLFGIARGGLLIAMVTFLVALTPLPEDIWWKESSLIGRFQVLAERVIGAVPPELADRVKRL